MRRQLFTMAASLLARLCCADAGGHDFENGAWKIALPTAFLRGRVIRSRKTWAMTPRSTPRLGGDSFSLHRVPRSDTRKAIMKSVSRHGPSAEPAGNMCEIALAKFERPATLSSTLFNRLDPLSIGDGHGCTVFGRAHMNRETALKVVLAVVGLLFLALVYPLAIFMQQEPALSMMFSLYVTLGVFLLLAIRNPSASRSLIAFTAWSSFAHAAVMGTQVLRGMVAHGEMIGVAILVIIGAALIALAPAKQLTERASLHSSYQPH